MKNYPRTLGTSFLLLLLAIFACHKSIINTHQPNLLPNGLDSLLITASDSTVAHTRPFPQTPMTGCNQLNYGNSIIYPQPTTGQDYIVSPINNPGPGKYLAWPAGMSIDSLTGAIDLTASETGQQYAIGFVKTGTTDTCISYLTIGGASYMDSIYNIGKGSGTAFPYFDGNPNIASICGSSPNGSAACSFDVTGSATNHKMVIDKSTGEIDLKKSLNGIFGIHPVNGQTAAITIYYQLDDASNRALQHIQVDVVYYDTQADMTTGLVGMIKNKHAAELAVQLISPNNNPRPPLIIIVRHD